MIDVESLCEPWPTVAVGVREPLSLVVSGVCPGYLDASVPINLAQCFLASTFLSNSQIVTK
jgi:hypothetical protein